MPRHTKQNNMKYMKLRHPSFRGTVLMFYKLNCVQNRQYIFKYLRKSLSVRGCKRMNRHSAFLLLLLLPFVFVGAVVNE